MTLNFINKYPTIKRWLVKQIGYYSKNLYVFSDNKLNDQQLSVVEDNNTRIIIIAKCHYSESWQSFSSINKNELNKIISLKKNSEAQVGAIFQIYKNDAIDGFDVKTIKIDQAIVTQLGRNRLYIPETELFLTDEVNQLLQIETPHGKIFCSRLEKKVKTSYAKGIVNNINNYKLSVGLSDDIQIIDVTANKFPQFLLTQLFKLKYSQLSKVLSFDIKSWFNATHIHLLYWTPTLSVLLFILVSNSYLWVTSSSMESLLEEKGDNVSLILDQKQKQDAIASLFNVFSEQLKQVRKYHPQWDVLQELLQLNMVVTQVKNEDDSIVISGNAENATYILEEVRKYTLIKSVGFKGGIRKSQNRDVFVLNIIIQGGN